MSAPFRHIAEGTTVQPASEEGEAALTSLLEHALEALDATPSAPRKDKKAARLLCEQVEKVLEEVDAEYATRLASQCETAELMELHVSDLEDAEEEVDAASPVAEDIQAVQKKAVGERVRQTNRDPKWTDERKAYVCSTSSFCTLAPRVVASGSRSLDLAAHPT